MVAMKQHLGESAWLLYPWHCVQSGPGVMSIIERQLSFKVTTGFTLWCNLNWDLNLAMCVGITGQHSHYEPSQRSGFGCNQVSTYKLRQLSPNMKTILTQLLNNFTANRAAWLVMTIYVFVILQAPHWRSDVTLCSRNTKQQLMPCTMNLERHEFDSTKNVYLPTIYPNISCSESITVTWSNPYFYYLECVCTTFYRLCNC